MSVGRLPHQTVVWVVCVRNVPSGVARGVALWTSCVSGAAPPAVSAGGAELRGAATVESLPPPAGSLALVRRLRMAEGGCVRCASEWCTRMPPLRCARGCGASVMPPPP